MKKLTALLLALVMVLSLAACGAKETTPKPRLLRPLLLSRPKLLSKKLPLPPLL